MGLLFATSCHSAAPRDTPPQSPSTQAALGTTAPAAVPELPVLDTSTRASLSTWYHAVGPPKDGETFGSLIVRAGRVQLGKPYLDEPSPVGPEALTCRLDSFECVSFVESTLALSRCIWRRTPDAACFTKMVTTLRYRGGQIDGYPSRLHFFEDWLADNAARGALVLMTAQLGGVPVAQPTTYMTAHPRLFPALADPAIRAAIAATETKVSAMHPAVLDRSLLHAAEWLLQDGDVIAVATFAPDILVSHTGFINHGADGVVRLLHASSFRHHVVLSEQDLAQYVLRRPERRGVLVARPVPPS